MLSSVSTGTHWQCRARDQLAWRARYETSRVHRSRSAAVKNTPVVWRGKWGTTEAPLRRLRLPAAQRLGSQPFCVLRPRSGTRRSSNCTVITTAGTGFCRTGLRRSQSRRRTLCCYVGCRFVSRSGLRGWLECDLSQNFDAPSAKITLQGWIAQRGRCGVSVRRCVRTADRSKGEHQSCTATITATISPGILRPLPNRVEQNEPL